jgi:hypothetical protein
LVDVVEKNLSVIQSDFSQATAQQVAQCCADSCAMTCSPGKALATGHLVAKKYGTGEQ